MPEQYVLIVISPAQKLGVFLHELKAELLSKKQRVKGRQGRDKHNQAEPGVEDIQGRGNGKNGYPFSQDEVTLEHNRSAQIVSPASVDELESAIGQIVDFRYFPKLRIDFGQSAQYTGVHQLLQPVSLHHIKPFDILLPFCVPPEHTNEEVDGIVQSD